MLQDGPGVVVWSQFGPDLAQRAFGGSTTIIHEEISELPQRGLAQPQINDYSRGNLEMTPVWLMPGRNTAPLVTVQTLLESCFG